MVAWDRTRSFFPVARRYAYLNHAGQAPISTRVQEGLRRWSDEACLRGSSERYEIEVARVRERAGILIGAQPGEIAFVPSTTQGLGLVASSLDWHRGDVVALSEREMPSNVYPWWQLRSQGVETRVLGTRDGRLHLEDVADALADPHVRLLTVSSVDFANGARNDLTQLGRLCRDRGVLFCVDAIQSLGCLPVDVGASEIDFLAAGGHKWLLAGDGCGILYCTSRLVDRMRPRVTGWHSVADPERFERFQRNLAPDARRFEPGTLDASGIYRLGAAIDLILEIGVDSIGRRVTELIDRLELALRDRGALIRSPSGPWASGILSFRLDHEPPQETLARLRDRRIVVAGRGGGVRVSPHFYNVEAEIDNLIDVL